jgi:hypothetical protein
MRSLQFVGLVLSFFLEVNASIPERSAKSASNPKREVEIAIKDFLISDIYSHSSHTSSISNNTLSCLYTQPRYGFILTVSVVIFADPNDNTSTICTDSWVQTNNTNGAPTSYVLCDATGTNDFYQWYFSSYTNLSNFQIQFAHIFADPMYVLE